MLLVAAGGGGDPIAAAALASALGLGANSTVMSYSWDRLVIDPLPGPRTVADFDGLRAADDDVWEVVPETMPRSPAGSALPRLANELPLRLLLLDPSAGAVGMARQISAASKSLGADELGLVDVGGDILAQGGEPNLRSPLADMLALAACTLTRVPCHLYVVGAGVDGELEEQTVLARLSKMGASQPAKCSAADFGGVRSVFGWHPSEASGLLAAASAGHRGKVETRDAASRVSMTDTTPTIFRIDAREAAEPSPARLLRSTESLKDAAGIIVKATGVDEIGYETAKAARLKALPAELPTAADLPAVDRHAEDAAARGADYVTLRRLAELVGATSQAALGSLHKLLRQERPDGYKPPLYRVTRQQEKDD